MIRSESWHLQYRSAVVKVFCSKRQGEEGWTGFVVNANPCIIITVSHPVDKFDNIVNDMEIFSVNFFGNAIKYRAVALQYSIDRDLLVLVCLEHPSIAQYFMFGDGQADSTTIFSVAHPDQRDWSILRGTICRAPFKIGKHNSYREDLEIFDHDVALYPGASGGPIINLRGEVIGMQLTQLTRKVHSLCVQSSQRKPQYPKPVTLENFHKMTWEVKELALVRCSIRQAVTVQYMAASFREMFPREASDHFITNINVFLRESVSRHIRRRGFQLGGVQSAAAAPQGSSSGKRTRREQARSLKPGCNKQTCQLEELSSVDFLSHAAAKNISQSSNGALVPNTDQAFWLNGSTFSKSERCQDVRGAKVMVDANTGWLKGSGSVRFRNENEKSGAMTEMNGQYCSRPMSIGVAIPKKPSTPQQQYCLQVDAAANCAFTQSSQSDDDQSNTTVFVGGLDFDVGQGEVRHTFSLSREDVPVKIPVGKGCGFVQFAERSSAENSINQLNGTVVGKQTVHLSWGRNPGNKQARSLKLGRNKQTGQLEELSSVEFLSHAAAKNISRSSNSALVPNTDQAYRLNGSTFSTSERCQDVRGAKVMVDANTGWLKGIGFVRFGDENGKSRAMTVMNGQYCSRPMGVGVATPKKPSTPQQQSSLQVGAAANCAFTQSSQSDDDTSNTTVFAGGLDFDVGGGEVGHTFSQFGEVVSVKRPIGKGCGFVQFAERTSAENSMNQLSGTVGKQTRSWGWNPGSNQARSLQPGCNKQTCQLEELSSIDFLSHAAAKNISQSSNGALVPNTDQAFWLNGSTFSKSERCQDVRGAKVMVDASIGWLKGSGFARFVNENEKSRAMTEMNGQHCSRPMGIGVAIPKKPSTPQQQYSLQVGAAANCAFTQCSQSDDDKSNTTVFVGGLGFDVGEGEVRHTFSLSGEDVSVKIAMGKGFGFVQFAERSSAENSINQLHGTVVGKQTVHLSRGRNFGNKQARSLKLGQTGQLEELSSVEFLPHAAAKNISQSSNGALVPNTDQAYRLNGSTFSTSERCQDVRGAKVMVDANTGWLKGSGFVRFGDENEKSRAMTVMNGLYCSRPMGIGVATPKKPSTPQQQHSSQVRAAANCAFTQSSQSDDDTSNTTVFVGGLDFDVGGEVGHTFSQFGEVVSVKRPIGKGCNFVQFAERTRLKTQ